MSQLVSSIETSFFDEPIVTTNWSLLSDQELVILTLESSHRAFEEIVNRYQEPILRYTLRLLNNNQQDAQDVVSESFFRAFKNLASYKPDHKFSSWLYRIAHNQAVSMIKSKSNMFFVDIENFFQIISPPKQEPIISLQELDQILDQLKLKDKNLLVLFYLEQKSLREISDILFLTENTVAQQLSRARQKARNIINKNIKLNQSI